MCETTTSTITIGDKVRSYDFPDDPRDDARGCFMEGVVTQIGDFSELGLDGPRYKVRVTRRFWVGQNEPVTYEGPRWVYPPVNGTPKVGGGVCYGVSKLEAFTESLTA